MGVSSGVVPKSMVTAVLPFTSADAVVGLGRVEASVSEARVAPSRPRAIGRRAGVVIKRSDNVGFFDMAVLSDICRVIAFRPKVLHCIEEQQARGRKC